MFDEDYFEHDDNEADDYRHEGEPLIDDEEESEPESFCIHSEETANWYLRQIGNIEAEKERISAQHAKRLAELETDRKRLQHLYSSQLEAWSCAELARRGGRRKTLTLEQASVAFRKVPSRLTVSDPVAALAYAKEHCPDMVKVQTIERLDAKRYTDLMKSTGEVLPGVERTLERESVTIEFGK